MIQKNIKITDNVIKINSSLGNKVYEDIVIPLAKSEYETIRNIMTECAIKKLKNNNYLHIDLEDYYSLYI